MVAASSVWPSLTIAAEDATTQSGGSVLQDPEVQDWIKNTIDANSHMVGPATTGEAIDIGFMDDIIKVMQAIQKTLLEKGGFLYNFGLYVAKSMAIIALILGVGGLLIGGDGEGLVRTGVKLVMAGGVLAFVVTNVWTPDNLDVARDGALGIARGVFAATHAASYKIRNVNNAGAGAVDKLMFGGQGSAGVFDNPSIVAKEYFGFGVPTAAQAAEAEAEANKPGILEDPYGYAVDLGTDMTVATAKLAWGIIKFLPAAGNSLLNLDRVLWKMLLYVLLFISLGVISLYLIMLNIEWYIVTTFAIMTLPLIIVPALRQVAMHTLHMALAMFLKYAAYALLIGIYLTLLRVMINSNMGAADLLNYTGPLTPGALDAMSNNTSSLMVMFGCTMVLVTLLFAMPSIVSRLVGQGLGLAGGAVGRAVGIGMAAAGTIAAVGALVATGGASAAGGMAMKGAGAIGKGGGGRQPSVPQD